MTEKLTQLATANVTTEEEKGTAKPGTATRYPDIRKVVAGFWVRARVHDPKTGKRRERTGILRDVEIEAALKAQLAWKEELLGPVLTAPTETVTVYAQQWMKRCVEVGEARATLENKTQCLERHILPHFGDYKLLAVERRDVKRWLTKVSSQTTPAGNRYSVATVMGWWRVLAAFFHWVVDEYELEKDPTWLIQPRKYLHRELRHNVQAEKGTNKLTVEELPRFLETARDLYPQHYAMLVLGFFTGMRWSELSALRWDAVNTETQEIEIKRSQYKGTVRLRTKGGTARSSAYNAFMKKVLDDHRERLMRLQAPGFDSGLVFPSDSGGPRFNSLMTKPLRQIAAAAGIKKKLSTKAFRRTYSDLMRLAQVDEIVKLASIGHADSRVSRLYSTVEPAEKQAALARVVALVGQGRS